MAEVSEPIPIRRREVMDRRGILLTAFLGLLLAGSGCRTTGRSAPSVSAPTASDAGMLFEDVTAAAGLRFTHHTGADGRFLMPESVGPGGAFFDYDGDGKQDIYLVNSSDWPGRGTSGSTGALYRNLGDGKFQNVTQEAGLAASMYGQGCAVGDYDGDGWDDLLVTCVGPNRLYRNLGNGGFRDVTRESGLGGGPRWAWHTSASWLDYDRDGALDLFVSRYVNWSPETDVPCKAASGAPTYCGPSQYRGDASVLYRNMGNGRFADVSKATGIAAASGKGLGVVAVDENEDGWVDLLVTNDLVPNHLWRNEGGRRFTEVAQEMGVAVGDSGAPRAGMGVDVADFRNDGGLGFGIGNFAGEGLALYARDPAGYTDAARGAGLAPASLNRLTFGLLFLDADRDGWQDLVAYNGHVDPHAGESGEAIAFRQPPQCFRNREGRFVDVTAQAGAVMQAPQVGRGSAVGDFDDDGRPDLLFCENAGPARLLRNVAPAAHHWLGVRLEGRGRNRNAYGAEVRLTSAGVTQRRWVRSGASYLSHSDSRALFGLGNVKAVDRLEIVWPRGRKTTHEAPDVDRYLTITEPE